MTTTSLFDPGDLRSRLLINFDKGTAGDKKLVLKSVGKVNWLRHRFSHVLLETVHGVKETSEVGNEGDKEDGVRMVLSLTLELRARNDTLDNIV